MVNYPQKNQSSRTNLVIFVIIPLLRSYRYLASPWIGNQCRFYPSCSYYSEQAFDHFGVFKGLYLTVRRLLKCHPWHIGGEDPIPDASHQSPHQHHRKD
jgi:uncharacterized protein